MLFVIGISLIWALRPVRPNVSIVFLGYTNNPSGTQFAQFAVTNLNTDTAQIYLPFIITQKVETFSYGYTVPRQYFFNTMLPGGANKQFSFPAPTNQSQWKLQLNCYPLVGIRHVIRNASALVMIHLNRQFRTMPYFLESKWIRGNSNITNNASSEGTPN